MSDNERNEFPVQIKSGYAREGSANRAVVMAAYEVYSEVFGSQAALITGDCRGGFATGELVAFLYARAFPRNEWSKRVDEAMKGLDV